MTQGNELDTTVTTEVTETAGQEVTTSETSEVDSAQAEVFKEPNTQETKSKKLSFADMKAGKFDNDTPDTKAQKAPKTPSYNPNFKFKVLDKELEFDDWAKSVVKDADTEKKVREVFEKAYGLDAVKSDRQTLKTNLAETTNTVKQYEKYHADLNEFLSNKDYDSFFDSVKIPEDDIIKYALELVKRKEDPNLRAQWQSERQQRQQANNFQSERAQFDSERSSFEVQRKSFELDTALLAPEAQAIAQAYDNGVGKPGAFKNYIIQLAASHSITSGQDIPAKEAVEMALAQVRAINPSLGGNAPTTPARVVTTAAKPVIPTVRGSGGSPVATKFKSFKDLTKRASELDSQA